MQHISLFSLFLLVYVFALSAQHPDAGTGIFSFVNIDYDANSVAMAGASVGMPGGGNNRVLANPASVAGIKHYQALIGYRNIIDDIWGGPVVVSRSFGKYGVFSILLAAITSGDIEVIREVNDEPYYTGQTAGAQYITGGISWAYPVLENLYFGTSIKSIYNLIRIPDNAYSAAAAVIDAGVQYQLLRGRFITGLALRNLGFLLWSYDDEKYDLPLTFEIGMSYAPLHLSNIRIALDINKRKTDYLNFEPGLEIAIYKEYLKGRLGYAFSWRDLQEAIKSFSGEQDENYIKSNWNAFCVGIGLNTDIEKTNVQIDFALQFHRVSLPPSVVVSALVDF